MTRTERLDRVIDAAVDAQDIVGCVVLVAERGETIYTRAAGWFDREAAVPMREDTIFRLASCTKPIVAATALAMREHDLLRLHHRVSDYLPDFRPKLPDGGEAAVTIRHLITHTSGLTYGLPVVAETGSGLTDTPVDLAEMVRLLGSTTLAFPPGTRWEYGMGIDVLGAIVAAVHGTTLAEAVADYVTTPLDMADTGFGAADLTRLAPPYADGPPGVRRMGDPELVIGPNGSQWAYSPSRLFSTTAFESGGAGMAGSAPDFLSFLETLRQGGGVILSPGTITEGFSSQIGTLPRPPQNAGRGFGLFGEVIEHPAFARVPQARGTVRWGGAYGHEWFVDSANELSVVSFTNTALGGSDGPFPARVRDAVYGVASAG